MSQIRRAGTPQGITVVIAAFLPILAIVSLFPAVPAMIDHFASDPRAGWMVPALVSAPGLTIAIAAIFAGLAVDRFGRRKLLLVSTLLYAVFGSAPFFLDSLDAIYGSRLALGFAEAAILTIMNTLIGDYWDDRGRRKWLTIQGIAGPFLASGVILASGYLTGVRWNGIFLIYLVALPIFVAMLLFLFEPENDDSARRMLGIDDDAPKSTPFPWGPVALLGAVTLFGSALYYVFIINGGMAFREVGIQNSARLGEVSFIPSLFVMAGAVLFWLLGKAGENVRLGVFLLLLGGGLTIMGLAPTWQVMVGGLIVQQTGAGMAIPTLIAWAATKLPFEHRGRGMGIWTACFFFGQFSSPFIVSLLRSFAGNMQAAFLVMGVLGLIGGLLAWLMIRERVALSANQSA